MNGRQGIAIIITLLAAMANAAAGTATVALDAPATTSAGVYDSAGRLVRTLWSGRKESAGNLAVDWDGRNDDGEVSPHSGRYTARVLAHNVRYVWEGVIGNTSRDRTGAGIYRALNPINDLAFDSAGNGFFVVGYNEGQPAIRRFQASDPQHQSTLARDDYRRVFRYSATDGSLAYFANIGLVNPKGAFNREPETFVVAVDVATGEEHRFSAGVVPKGTPGRWQSVIDFDRDDFDANGVFRSAPTGLAVQRRGSLLFVAHGGLGEVRILDKRTGARIGNIGVADVIDMDMGPGDDLLLLSRSGGRNTVLRCRLIGGSWTTETVVSSGLIDPTAIGVSPLDGTIVVVDAGSEQLKAFESEGRAAWTLGREGGYRSGGPEVTLDKFWFSGGPTYVAFQADGSFWFGDRGNLRNLHYSSKREYLDQIMYLPKSYVVAVDSSRPERVFRHFLEFRVDYARPIAESWTLERNWAAGMPRGYFGEFEGLQAVHTLGNGRTYGVVRHHAAGVNEVVELTAQGLRPVGMKLEFGTKLYPDGSLRSHLIRFGKLGIYSRELQGFGEEGNPRWGGPMLVGGATLQPSDPYYHDVPMVDTVNEPTYPTTSSGVVVSFNPGKSAGFHLGGISSGSNEWLWRASPSGSWNLDDDNNIAPKDGHYDIGNGVQYPGNVVMTAGRQIIYGYHGEAWRGGQANQFVHFYDNGLFVGQFGRTGLVHPSEKGIEAPPEAAGNNFSPQLVMENGKLYLWHNDEHAHAGVHRWRIDGTDQIRILETDIAP